MQLPFELREAIESVLTGIKPEALAKAAADLSERYRSGEPQRRAAISSDAHALAYLATRLPATYAAVRSVLAEIRDRMPEVSFTSMLDLGAGPGTAAWAAADLYDELETVTLVERDRHLLALGERLAQNAAAGALRSARRIAANLEVNPDLESHDLVVLSYSLGELKLPAQERLLRRAWDLARKTVVVIEPGTTQGYAAVLRARDEWLKAGARVVAPCPHAERCPLEGRDWCHFSQRVERATFHRRAKAGSSAYEDEKFSYFAAAKAQPVRRAAARILRHPMILKGHIRLELCAEDGLRRLTVTRSHREAFRRARKAEWGDAWEAGVDPSDEEATETE